MKVIQKDLPQSSRQGIVDNLQLQKNSLNVHQIGGKHGRFLSDDESLVIQTCVKISQCYYCC